MYLFNPFLLARMLRDEALSEWQKCKLVVTSVLLQSGYNLVGVFWGSGGARANALWGIAFRLAVVLVALRLCFRANERGDGRQFVERFFCLCVPLSFWFSLLPYAGDLGLYYALYAVYGAAVHALWRRLYPVLLVWIWSRFVLAYALLPFFFQTAASKNRLPSQSPVAPIAAP